MSENLRTYTKAVYAFDHVLKMATAKAGDKAFTRKAPCAGWTGKDVYEHVAGNLKMIQSYATTGRGPRSMPKLGADPLAAWAKLRDQTLAALDQPDVLESTAHEPFGPAMGSFPMDTLLGLMAADLTVHVWDMARTAKVDERLDSGLVKQSAATWKGLPEEVLRGPGMFGPAVRSERGADAQTRLLNRLGRSV